MVPKEISIVDAYIALILAGEVRGAKLNAALTMGYSEEYAKKEASRILAKPEAIQRVSIALEIAALRPGQVSVEALTEKLMFAAQEALDKGDQRTAKDCYREAGLLNSLYTLPTKQVDHQHTHSLKAGRERVKRIKGEVIDVDKSLISKETTGPITPTAGGSPTHEDEGV